MDVKIKKYEVALLESQHQVELHHSRRFASSSSAATGHRPETVWTQKNYGVGVQSKGTSRFDDAPVKDEEFIGEEPDSSLEEVENTAVEPDHAAFERWWPKQQVDIPDTLVDAREYFKKFSRWAFLDGNSEMQASTCRQAHENSR